MAHRREEAGFTLIEVLVTIAIFSFVSVAFYQVVFSASRGAGTSTSVTAVSGEARLGFNRLVRDTREGQVLSYADANSFRVLVDFDANGVPVPSPSVNSSGDAEDLTFAWNPATQVVTLNNEVLMRGVDCVRASNGTCLRPVFDYSSNRLEYDYDKNGITTWQELDETGAAARSVVGVGNNNRLTVPRPDGGELSLITSVQFSMVVSEGDQSTSFLATAQLRNQR